MQFSDYDKKLVRTFIKDYHLPIQPVSKDNFFFLIDAYGHTDLWNSFVDVVNSFPGNLEQQMNAFYEARDKVIDDIVNSIQEKKSYREFNICDMSRYDTNFEIEKPYELYNIVSIDLKHANIQALHYADHDITFDSIDWCGLVTNCVKDVSNKMFDYVVSSKHIRQVALGKLNPKRAITVEKHLMSKIHDLIKSKNFNFKLIEVNNDELKYAMYISLSTFETLCLSDLIKDCIRYNLGLEVRVESYSVMKFRLKNTSSGDFTQTMELITTSDGKRYPRCVPGHLYGIVHCLLTGKTVKTEFKHFVNDNMNCAIVDDFLLYDNEGNQILKTLVNENA